MNTIHNIVLLHGWGCDSRIWQSILPFFESFADTLTLDINDLIEANILSEKIAGKNLGPNQVRKLVDSIAQQLPENALVCGWSLGGMLAAQLAERYPQKVLGLITLASNAVFTQNEKLEGDSKVSGWSEAMPLETFETFFSLLKKNHKKALKRFSLLEVNGDENAKEQMLYLQEVAADIHSDVLEVGLELLANINNIDTISKIACPALYCFGREDALVPVSTKGLFESQINEESKIVCLDGRGHLLHYPNGMLTEQVKMFLAAFVFSKSGQNQGEKL